MLRPVSLVVLVLLVGGCGLVARVVPTLSRDDQVAGPAIVSFVNGLSCS